MQSKNKGKSKSKIQVDKYLCQGSKLGCERIQCPHLYPHEHIKGCTKHKHNPPCPEFLRLKGVEVWCEKIS